MFARSWKAQAPWIVALGTVVLLRAPPARGADPEEPGRELFDAGVKAYQEGAYDAAIASFQQAYRLTQRQGLLFSIAQALRRSYETTGKPEQLREALRYYARYLSSNPQADHRAEAESWLQQLRRLPDAQGWEAAATAKPAHTQLVIAVNVAAAKVELDGQLVPVLPHAAEVEPGKHHVEVAAEGYELFRKDVEVPRGTALPLNIELRALPSGVEVIGNAGAEVMIDHVSAGHLPSPAFALPPGRHSLEVRQAGHYTVERTIVVSGTRQRLHLIGAATTRRTVSWALIGAGAAATVVGGLFGYLALQKQEDARSLQDQPGTTAAFDDAIKARDSLRLGAFVSAGVGVTAAIGGAISIATEGFGPLRPTGSAKSGSAFRYQLSPFGVTCSAAF